MSSFSERFPAKEPIEPKRSVFPSRSPFSPEESEIIDAYFFAQKAAGKQIKLVSPPEILAEIGRKIGMSELGNILFDFYDPPHPQAGFAHCILDIYKGYGDYLNEKITREELEEKVTKLGKSKFPSESAKQAETDMSRLVGGYITGKITQEALEEKGAELQRAIFLPGDGEHTKKVILDHIEATWDKFVGTCMGRGQW